MIRVLIIDDSTTARSLIRAIIDTDPNMQVVGEASDGLEGVEMAAELRPDVITMDVNMPYMNGYQATQVIMSSMPTPIVVVTSVSMDEMVHDGLNILLAGALEIVQKPSTLITRTPQSIADELLTKIIAVSQVNFA